MREGDRHSIGLTMISAIAEDEMDGAFFAGENSLFRVLGGKEQGDHIDRDRLAGGIGLHLVTGGKAVSYTHLDVYKRQGGGRRSPQSGTTVPEVAAVRARLREVQSKVAHRYSVLFWAPNKEKPLRAAG